jgi:DNA-binding XRE family transcriptional regulator
MRIVAQPLSAFASHRYKSKSKPFCVCGHKRPQLRLWGRETNSLGSREIPSLDGLRAISIAIVIFSHAKRGFGLLEGPVSFLIDGGHFGVRIFFCVSGFLITYLLLLERKRTERIDLQIRPHHNSRDISSGLIDGAVPALVLKGRTLVAWNLRRIRVRRGLSQERLAFDAGVDRSYVGGLVRGEQNPTVDLLDRLAHTLSVRIADFFVEPNRGSSAP